MRMKACEQRFSLRNEDLPYVGTAKQLPVPLELPEQLLGLVRHGLNLLPEVGRDQVFHRDETIKGIKDLSVTVFLSPSTLRPYVYWCCSGYG